MSYKYASEFTKNKRYKSEQIFKLESKKPKTKCLYLWTTALTSDWFDNRFLITGLYKKLNVDPKLFDI